MRKVLLFILMWLFQFTVFSESEEDITTFKKEIVDKSTKDYSASMNSNFDISEKKVFSSDEMKLNLKEEKERIKSEFKIDTVQLTRQDDKNIIEIKILPPVVTPEPPSDGPKTNQVEKSYKNYIIFGLGGYDKIDAFRYIIDYTKDDKTKDLAYYLHLGREIKGEYRFNSDINMDNYLGKIWWKNFSLNISHVIIDQKLPGRLYANSPVSSWRKEKMTELIADYDIIKKPDINLKAGVNLYLKDVSASVAPSQREYVNNLYSFFSNFDYIIKLKDIKFMDFGDINNTINADLIYFADYLDINEKYLYQSDYSIGNLKLELKDIIKVSRYENMDLRLKLGSEFVNNKKLGKENNFSFDIMVTKKINDMINLSYTISNETQNIPMKDLNKKFEECYDILAFTDKKSESNFKNELAGYFNYEKFSNSTKLRYIVSDNKIIFEEDDDNPYFKDEIPIKVYNYSNTLRWLEFETNFNYKINDFNFNSIYNFTTLDNISFVPQHKLDLKLSYKSGEHFAELNNKYFSDMYGKLNNVNKLGGYGILNFIYVYNFSKNLDISLKIKNILNRKYNYKTEYEAENRKIMAEFKITY